MLEIGRGTNSGEACLCIANEANSGYREGRAAAPNIDCEGADSTSPSKHSLVINAMICYFMLVMLCCDLVTWLCR